MKEIIFEFSKDFVTEVKKPQYFKQGCSGVNPDIRILKKTYENI